MPPYSTEPPARAVVQRLGALVGALTLVLFSAMALSGPASAALLPPDNPAANIAASPNITGPTACYQDGGGWECNNPCVQSPTLTEDDTPTCVDGALEAIDAARADEGLGPMVLPSNWYSLTVPEQTFVVTNLERTARGETPITGLVGAADTDAQTAAEESSDPSFGDAFGFNAWGSVWDGNSGNPLAADYIYMYDDGWGGSAADTFNTTCTSAVDSQCWDHRDVLLSFANCTNCVAGAGYDVDAADGWILSYTELLVEPSGSVPPAVFSWAGDVVPYLSDGISAVSAANSIVGLAATPDGNGYWLASADGDVQSFGDAVNYGSMEGDNLSAPIRSIVATPDGRGYWLLGADGGIFNFGDAGYYGSTGAMHLNAPIVAMTPTSDGKGYWLVAADGGIFNFGDARYYGSLPGDQVSVGNVVGIVHSAGGGGYWMVGSDGGVFAFGNAGYIGSLPGDHVNVHDVVGIVPTNDNQGYWMVGSDGGVFAFGNAGYIGSLPASGIHTNDIVDLVPTPSGNGYWMVGTDGGVFALGAAPYYGSSS